MIAPCYDRISQMNTGNMSSQWRSVQSGAVQSPSATTLAEHRAMQSCPGLLWLTPFRGAAEARLVSTA